MGLSIHNHSPYSSKDCFFNIHTCTCVSIQSTLYSFPILSHPLFHDQTLPSLQFNTNWSHSVLIEGGSIYWSVGCLIRPTLLKKNDSWQHPSIVNGSSARCGTSWVSPHPFWDLGLWSYVSLVCAVKATVRSSMQVHCHTMSYCFTEDVHSLWLLQSFLSSFTVGLEPPGAGYIDDLFRVAHATVSCSVHVAT